MVKILRSAAVLAVIAAPMLSVPAGGAAEGDVVAVSGEAFGFSGTSTDGSVDVSPTPLLVLPTTGGGPFVEVVEDLHAAGTTFARIEVTAQGTSGPGGSAISSVSVLDAVFPDGLLTIDEVTAECRAGRDGADILVSIIGGLFFDMPLPENPAPNTILEFDLEDTVIIISLNEHLAVPETSGVSASANAMRLTFLLGDQTSIDVVIGHVACAVETEHAIPPPPPPPPPVRVEPAFTG